MANNTLSRWTANIKKVSRETGRSGLRVWLDVIACTVFLQAGMSNYIVYKFYNMPWKERRTYFTLGGQAMYYPTLMPRKYNGELKNKLLFHKIFSEYTGREYYDPNTSTAEELAAFLARTPVFFEKPPMSSRGHGIRRRRAEQIGDAGTYYAELKEKGLYLEEPIRQNKDWAALNPETVNTLRIFSFCADGAAKVVFACARVGNGDSVTDNFSGGGMAALIDMDSACLRGNALTRAGEETALSPSGIPFEGFPVPYWEEIKELICKAALMQPRLHLIAWDVAIGENGPLLVEGNANHPGLNLPQLLMKRGIKKDMRELYRAAKASDRKRARSEKE